MITKRECALPKETKVMIEASDRVNVDEHGRSLPTVVNLLQVPSLDKIEGSSFDDIWLRPEETFQDQLLGTTSQTIYPGQSLSKPVSIEINPKAKFLVAMAIFRQPSGTTWRATYELPATFEEICNAEDKGIYLRFSLQDSQIEGGEETAPKEASKEEI
jgi:type VI secretion system protein VasD